jgi:hypothetical protein
MNITNEAIKLLASKSWVEILTEDKLKIFGLFSVIGGWSPPIKVGQPVKVEINN